MSLKNVAFQPVTAIYDLGRESIDGRSFQQYVSWLEQTINLFPNLIVYCDEIPKIEQVEHLGNWVVKKKESFALWDSIDKVSKICDQSRKFSEDVTFQIPAYGILQFSKFEILKELSILKSNPNLLWIDAGISRFILPEIQTLEDQLAIPREVLEFDEALFEIDLRRNVFLGKLRKVKVGSCRRTFSGGSFMIKRNQTEHYFQALKSKAEFWIENNVWDNEQIGLNSCYHDGSISPEFIEQDEIAGTIARRILESTMHEKKILNRKKLSRKMFA